MTLEKLIERTAKEIHDSPTVNSHYVLRQFARALLRHVLREADKNRTRIAPVIKKTLKELK